MTMQAHHERHLIANPGMPKLILTHLGASPWTTLSGLYKKGVMKKTLLVNPLVEKSFMAGVLREMIERHEVIVRQRRWGGGTIPLYALAGTSTAEADLPKACQPLGMRKMTRSTEAREQALLTALSEGA